jgi:hypothetical protein
MPAQYHAALNPIADIAAGMAPKPWKETFMSAISYHAANVDGLKIFYREAGRRDAPTSRLKSTFSTMATTTVRASVGLINAGPAIGTSAQISFALTSELPASQPRLIA